MFCHFVLTYLFIVNYIYDMTSLFFFCLAANRMTRLSTTEVTIDKLIKC
jgi:hypothetical protein